MKLSIWLRGLPLFGFSFFEMAASFVRMLILTHVLGPYEFGFAAAISATYATIEQITDIAIYRFVFSSHRSIYHETLSGAHALTIIRGVFLAGCILVVSYPLACTLATCGDWPSFSWLAPITIIKSYEHLEIRVAERDYRYWPQFIASLVSHGSGLIALTVIAYKTGSHYGFIAYLVVQAMVYVLASHLLAAKRYQAKFCSPYLQRAFEFGLPLMLNGAGLAIVGQGDRLMVGSLLGLPFLGLYAVIVLAGLVPIGGIFRILGPLFLAGLHNAHPDKGEYESRLQLFSRAVPIIAGCYGLLLVALLKPTLPIVFGERYVISDVEVLLVALIAFARIVRIEPYTSVLLNFQRTKELAIANLSTIAGLIVATFLAWIYHSIESVLVGILLGEMVGICVVTLLASRLLKFVNVDYAVSLLFVAMALGSAGALVLLLQATTILGRSTIAGGFLLLIVAGAAVFLPGPYQAAKRA